MRESPHDRQGPADDSQERGCLHHGLRWLAHLAIWWVIRSTAFLVITLAAAGLIVMWGGRSWSSALWFGIPIAVVLMGIYIILIEPFIDLLRAARQINIDQSMTSEAMNDTGADQDKSSHT